MHCAVLMLYRAFAFHHELLLEAICRLVCRHVLLLELRLLLRLQRLELQGLLGLEVVRLLLQSGLLGAAFQLQR